MNSVTKKPLQDFNMLIFYNSVLCLHHCRTNNHINLLKELKLVKVKNKVSILFSVALFCGMATIGSEALALEIGDEITAAIPATPAMPATLATLATPAVKITNNDFASGAVIDSTLAEFGEEISARTATQADVDAGVRLGVDNLGALVKINDDIVARKAFDVDVTAGAMLDSTPITKDDIFANDGKYGQFILSGFNTRDGEIHGFLGKTVLERIATEADVIANVTSSGTLVKLDDVVFGGVATTASMADSPSRTATADELAAGDAWVTADDITIVPEGVARNEAGNIIVTDGHAFVENNAIINTPSVNSVDVDVVAGFDREGVTQVNGVAAVKDQMIASRITSNADVNADVIIFEDGIPRAVTEQDVTNGLIIPARAATAKDVEAGALINGTELEVGDLYYDGYADQADVDAKKTTGNVFVTEGDTILSRAATVEDIAAGVFTGGKLVAIDELIPGAVIVTAADVEAGLKIDGVAAVAGDIIFLAKEATEATEATVANPGSDAVLATANDVYEWVTADIPEDLKAELDGMSQNLSGMEKLTAISAITEKDDAFFAAGKLLSEKDNATFLRSAFGLVSDIKAFDEYNTAVDEVIAGTMTFDEIRTKINPDVGSGTGSVFTGISAVSNSIGSHQMNLIASSGKYGPKKYLAGLDSGKNSGSSSMNTSAWMEGFISDSTMDMRDSVAGYNASTHGVTFGIDTMLANDSIVGFAFSYANIDVDGKSVANSQTDTDQFQGTLYGSVMQDIYFLNASLSYAHGESDTSRATFGGKATGSYGTDIYSMELGAGMPIVNGDMTITPQTTMRYSAISTDAYTEDGNSALDVSVEDMNMLTLKTGVSFEDKIKLSEASIIPKMRLMVDWDILREKAVTTASWVSTGATIVPIDGPKPAAFGGSVGVGFDYATDNGLYVISLDYDMSAKPDYISHAGIAKLRMNF